MIMSFMSLVQTRLLRNLKASLLGLLRTSQGLITLFRKKYSVALIAFCDYDTEFIFRLTDRTISFIVHKVDAAVQTLCDEVLEQQGMIDIKGCREEVKENVYEKSLDCEKGNVYAGIPREMDNYVACRLATPFLPSPLLDRRTIL